MRGAEPLAITQAASCLLLKGKPPHGRCATLLAHVSVLAPAVWLVTPEGLVLYDITHCGRSKQH